MYWTFLFNIFSKTFIFTFLKFYRKIFTEKKSILQIKHKNEKLVDTQYRNWISRSKKWFLRTNQKLTLLDKSYKYSSVGKREYRWCHYPFSDGKRNLMARVGIHLDAWSIDNELTLSRVVSLFLSFFLSCSLFIYDATR